MKYRNDNMLLRIAQADAYALAAEYVQRDPSEQEYQDLLEIKRYIQHPRYHLCPAGTYTDDTQMSIAVAEVLLQGARSNAMIENSLTSNQFNAAFYEVFKRDQRDGYSRGFQKILEQATSPEHLRQLIIPNSTKNGAAMRSVPLGVICNPNDVSYYATIQASTTHCTSEGIISSKLVALMSHYALYEDGEFSQLLDWGKQYHAWFEYFREPWTGPVKLKHTHKSTFDIGMNTVWAVHTLLVEEKSLKDIMKRLLTWGGDTDSVAAIAWGIASSRYQDEVLPEFLERDLEPSGKYGVPFLKGLGKLLMDAYE